MLSVKQESQRKLPDSKPILLQFLSEMDKEPNSQLKSTFQSKTVSYKTL